MKGCLFGVNSTLEIELHIDKVSFFFVICKKKEKEIATTAECPKLWAVTKKTS